MNLSFFCSISDGMLYEACSAKSLAPPTFQNNLESYIGSVGFESIKEQTKNLSSLYIKLKFFGQRWVLQLVINKVELGKVLNCSFFKLIDYN